MKRFRFVPPMATVFCALVGWPVGCDCDGSPADPCAGVACSGAGECRLTPFVAEPYCACWPGYHPAADGLECVPNDPGDPCAGVYCSDHGSCVPTGPVPVCVCDDGYERDLSGLYCFSTTPPPADADAAGADADSSAETDADASAEADAPPSWWADRTVREPGLTKLDIVFMVDNSGSMSQEQAALTARFPELLAELLDPPDTDGDTRPDHAAVEDLNVGVISSDMGVAGYRVSTCTNEDVGDNGCFRSTPSPAVLGCAPTYPHFLARNPTNAAEYSPEQMATDLTCIATLGTQGCGFEQQLKAMRGALTVDTVPGGCNAGFLRNDSLLALIWVTDEEDCSVRSDHTEMFDPERNDLGNLNIRCFTHPDFVEPVSDYVTAFRSLRSTGDANVFLAMIVGVPPDAAECIGFGDGLTECLDVPEMIAWVDPSEPTSLVPSCNTPMGQAFPPRRFVALAQEWGKNAYVDSICKSDWTQAFAVIGGRLVESLRDDYVCLAEAPPFDGATCTAGCWMIETLSDERWCDEDPECPSSWCPPATAEIVNRLEPCRDPATGAECVPLKRDLGLAVASGYPRRQCLVRQVPRDPAAPRCGDPLGDGWYFVPEPWSVHFCPEVDFARTGPVALLSGDSRVDLRCPR
ncbi:MAG: hypothetical protein HY907_06590 [Deltaproteobacteria bacterium]|nr:hypothetical protein [Deltaproteobacteria bacterium]